MQPIDEGFQAFYITGIMTDDGRMSFASSSEKYYIEEKALEEQTRLANCNKGVPFIVMKLHSILSVDVAIEVSQ